MSTAKDAFTGRMFRRMLAPALISAVGLALSDMADAIVVGQRMGEVGLAAIGMSLPLYMVLNVLMHGFGTGGSVRYARLLGEGRPREAVLSFNRVLRAALGVSVALAAGVNLFPHAVMRLLGADSRDAALYSATLDYVRVIALGAPLFFLHYILNDYLRSDGDAKAASAAALAGNATDIALNVVLVAVLGYGTAGAAWATVAGLAVSCLCYLPALMSKSHTLSLLSGRVGAVWGEALPILRAGFATSSQYLWQMAFLLVANHTLMARLGSQGVAVFDMLQNASYLIVYLYDAACKALQPLASTYMGERNRPAALRALRAALCSGLGVGITAAALIAAFPQAVCTVFGLTEPGTLALASHALRIYCSGAGLMGVSLLLESYAQAVEEERCALMLTLLRGGVVLLPATLALGVLAPQAFWLVFPITEALSLLLFALWHRFVYKPARPFDPERVYASAIHSRTDDIGALTQAIEAFCDRFSASTRQKYFVTMAAEEISLAIIDGGFAGREDGVIQLTLIALEDGQFELHLRDNATTFDPFSLHTVKAGEGDFDMDAMGILVIRKRAKFFFYRRYAGFNTLTVRI